MKDQMGVRAEDRSALVEERKASFVACSFEELGFHCDEVWDVRA